MSRSMKLLALFLVALFVLAACRREEEAEPTAAPAAAQPTEAPTEEPMEEPTEEPMEEPTEEPMEEPTEEPMEEAGPIKVAFLGPLTGVAASLGQEMFGFAKVTVDLFNERTGLDVELVEGDTEINPDVGKVVAERLAADEDIYAVIGPAGSQVCESTQPVFEDAGLAHITPTCTATFLTDPGTPTFFRVVPNDADQSETAADVMINSLGVESVFLVDNQDTYSVNLDDEVEALLTEAGVPFDRASIPQEETDMSAVATAVINFGADAVFFPSQTIAQIGTLAVQLREQGYEGIYFLADGGFAPDWVEAAGDAAEGTYVTSFAPDPNSIDSMAPYNERYAAEFTESFGAFGGATSLATYVALDAIETCIRAGDISRACVVDALTNIDLATTNMGLPIMFGPGNQAEGAFALFQVQDGEFVYIGQ
jgi:branched-chain amino acid transport system substrate-binding protein